MKIWVDADACPKAIKEIVCRAAERTNIETLFIANARLYLAVSEYIRFIQVPHGADIADDYIVTMPENLELKYYQDWRELVLLFDDRLNLAKLLNFDFALPKP